MRKTISDLAQEALRKSVWSTPGVSQQPKLTMIRWSVMETSTGDRHLIGYCFENREGRVSTPIVDVDGIAGQVTTQSGRTYQLRGGPGYDHDGSWVWSVWSNALKITGRDVTEEFIETIGEFLKSEAHWGEGRYKVDR